MLQKIIKEYRNFFNVKETTSDRVVIFRMVLLAVLVLGLGLVIGTLY